LRESQLLRKVIRKSVSIGSLTLGHWLICPPKPQQNDLLVALSAQSQQRLLTYLELITLPQGKVLYESGDALCHIYFPTDAIISLLYVMENGASAEISVAGNEGLIGIAIFMGGETPNNGKIR